MIFAEGKTKFDQFRTHLVLFLTNEGDIQYAAKRGSLEAQQLCAAFVLIRDSNMRGCTSESDVAMFNAASEAYWGWPYAS